MKPFRLFVTLVLLTASMLAVVGLRVGSVCTAYRVQRLHARQWELRRQLASQRALIAERSEPQLILELVRSGAIPLTPPQLPGSPSDGQEARDEWETD